MKLSLKERNQVKEFAKNLVEKRLNEQTYIVTVKDTQDQNSEHSEEINANSFVDAYIGYLSKYQNYYDLDNVEDTKKNFLKNSKKKMGIVTFIDGTDLYTIKK